MILSGYIAPNIPFDLYDLEGGAARGIAIITPGFNETKEEPYLLAMARAFNQEGYRALIYEPLFFLDERKQRDITFDGYVRNLNLAHTWVKRTFSHKKVVLAGHSIGAAASFQYAQQVPKEIEKLVMLAPLINKTIYFRESLANWPEVFSEWEAQGFLKKQNMRGEEVDISYNFVKTLSKMNVLKLAPQNKTPTLVIAATRDKSTPLNEVQKVVEKMPKAELATIEAGHFFKNEEEQTAIFDTLNSWLKNGEMKGVANPISMARTKVREG